jgi:predicted ATPase/DNA-binding CsgD family transcriptional regulator
MKPENNTRKIQTIVEERISSTMVGRAAETELFQKQFDRVLEGGTGLVAISGRPGIGKTFFAEHAAGLFAGGGATYLHGKFRQYDSQPLTAFSEVIEQAVRHILTLPTESLEHIKNDLNQRLGADAGIILSVCPYAGMLLGAHKPIQTDNLEQLKYRVRKAVGRFLSIASTALFPLIIFLDDLQWADPLSIQIIETVCQDYGSLNIMLVLACRDRDQGVNPAKLPKDGDIFIRLSGLSDGDIDQYIRQIFGEEIEHKEYLVRILYGLTLGNPFNISRIIRILLQENAVAWSAASKTWQLRLDRMGKLNLPTDIEQLLKKQIDGLEPEDRELLRLIACCGDTGTDLLGVLTGAEDAALIARLSRLCGKSLLTKTVWVDRQDGTGPGGGIIRRGGASYGFVHDIVLKLVYNSLSAEERSDIHYRVANILAGQENSAVALASHLLKTDLPLLQQNRPEKWAGVLFRAGVEAKQGAAAEQALEMLERCAELRSGFAQREKSGFDLELRLELAECRNICGQIEAAKRDCEALLADYPETEKQVRIKRKYIIFSALSGDYEGVLETGAQILSLLNFRLSAADIIPNLIKSRLMLSNRKISRLENAPDIADRRILCILETLANMLPAANRVSDRMSAELALKMTILSVKYGNSDYAPVAYASYVYVLFHILKDHKRGKRLEEAALSLIDRCGDVASRFISRSILGSMTHHWSHPLNDTAACLERAFSEADKEGSFTYGGYAAVFAIITKYMTGETLSGLKEYIGNFNKRKRIYEHYLSSSIYGVYEKHIRWLEEGYFPEAQPPSDYNKLYANIIKLSGDVLAIQRLYLEGKAPEAYLQAEESEPEAALHRGFALNIEFIFYAALARIAAQHSLSTDGQRRHNKKMIETHLHTLKYTVSVYPGNHRARYLLVQAEYDAQFRPERASDKTYREAMDFAERQGNLSLEALANLLAANYHRDDRRLSEFYRSEAARLYKKWGADHVAGLIAGRAGAGLPVESAASNPAGSGASKNPAAVNLESVSAAAVSSAPVSGQPAAEAAGNADADILLHLSRMEKLPEDESYLYFLDLLVRRGRADYCAVFFERSEEMYLKYEMRKDGEALAHREPVNMNHLASLPHKVLRYVARTETEILMDSKPAYGVKPGAPAYGIFAGDAYFAEESKLSLLCLPLKYSGVLAGIIYLEKTDEEGFDGRLPSMVKGFLPTLLSRRTNLAILGDTNVRGEMTARGGGRLQNKNAAPAGNAALTDREIEVLALIAQGMSNAEISKKLFITLGTVRNHLSSIYSKLEADNRVKAVMKAKELKIIRI